MWGRLLGPKFWIILYSHIDIRCHKMSRQFSYEPANYRGIMFSDPWRSGTRVILWHLQRRCRRLHCWRSSDGDDLGIMFALIRHYIRHNAPLELPVISRGRGCCWQAGIDTNDWVLLQSAKTFLRQSCFVVRCYRIVPYSFRHCPLRKNNIPGPLRAGRQSLSGNGLNESTFYYLVGFAPCLPTYSADVLLLLLSALTFYW